MNREKTRKTVTLYRDLIGEGLHSGLRRAADSEAAARAWRAIGDMPDQEWAAVIEWMIDGATPHHIVRTEGDV